MLRSTWTASYRTAGRGVNEKLAWLAFFFLRPVAEWPIVRVMEANATTVCDNCEKPSAVLIRDGLLLLCGACLANYYGSGADDAGCC